MAGSPRYLRYILFAFLALIVLFFISSSSSSAVPGGRQLQQATEMFKNQNSKIWKNPPQQQLNAKPKASEAEADAEASASASSPANSISSTSPPPSQTATSDTNASKGASSSSDSKHQVSQDTKLTTSPNPHLGTGKTNLPPKKGSVERVNATFVSLARNSDVWEISRSIRQVEDRFNRNYNYDWVFLNDDDFDETFKKVTTALTSGNARYGRIQSEHWGFPEFIDQDRAAKVREDMHERKIIYGDSISYRHMCRYESGFFFRHPLMMEYEYYWRVEPSIELYCDVSYDPFKMMKDKGKKYSFVISLYEYVETIPTLWDSVKKFIEKHPEHIEPDNSIKFISDDDGQSYNHCHFWSNFEIGNLNWLRSQAYIDYFEHLDREGGFFYERWGDAPVHSIAAALMLKKDEIHFFNDIAYYHVPFTHCPTGEQLRTDLRCHCNPGDNFDWNGYSCTSRYFDLNNIPKPEGWEQEQ